MRVAELLAVIALGLPVSLAGCDQKNESSLQAATDPSAPIDWSKVSASAAEPSLNTAFHLSRVVDVWHKGKSKSVILRYEGDGVTDSEGHRFIVSKEDFKGIRAAIEGKGQPMATRALPAKAHNYKDGLGKAKRHAYFVEAGPDNTMIFKLAKELDDSSEG